MKEAFTQFAYFWDCHYTGKIDPANGSLQINNRTVKSGLQIRLSYNR